ncbi:hypothetical protein [Candidatus Clostridium stratigraminis]|uniref:Uncharacterized protein n=1 Tax=Candidatus Clostridium stratigraminis TaxID=3381661 RepID=A0ABW8T8A5_9CLOT
MRKEPIMHKLFGFIDRDVHASDFIDTRHLNMMNLPLNHLKDSSKYNSHGEDYKYL